MTTLIVLVIFGLIFAFFATQNTSGVNVKFQNYELFNIPLYVIVLGSLLIGLLMSWIVNMLDGISSALTIHGKDTQIKQIQKAVNELNSEIHDLEIENARLKGADKASDKEVFVEKEMEVRPKNLFDRVRDAFHPKLKGYSY